jgi:hypothetical protein
MNQLLNRILKKNKKLPKGIEDDPTLSLIYLMKKDMEKKANEFKSLKKDINAKICNRDTDT